MEQQNIPDHCFGFSLNGGLYYGYSFRFIGEIQTQTSKRLLNSGTNYWVDESKEEKELEFGMEGGKSACSCDPSLSLGCWMGLLYLRVF